MPFNFNFYSSLLLPAFVQGVLFSILLFYRFRKEGNWSDFFLAGIIALYTIRVSNWMLGFAGWYDSHDGFSTFMFYFPFNNWLALGPLVYFGFKSLTNANFRFRKEDFWHFVLPVLSLIMDLIFFIKDILVDQLIHGKELPHHFGTLGPLGQDGLGPSFSIIISVVEYISILAYFIITIRMYLGYRKYINQNFSKTDDINFSWLRNFLYAVVLGQLVLISFQVLDLFGGFQNTYTQDWYSYFAWGLIIFYLSIQGYYTNTASIQKLQFEDHSINAPEAQESVTKSNLPQELLRHIEENKPYLNPDLSLADLAKQMQCSPVSLSQTINVSFGQNFKEWVNSYRIREAQSKLLDEQNSHLSILGIAYESGFNSKATFNRTFKKTTGKTPTEYIKSQKNEVSDS